MNHIKDLVKKFAENLFKVFLDKVFNPIAGIAIDKALSELHGELDWGQSYGLDIDLAVTGQVDVMGHKGEVDFKIKAEGGGKKILPFDMDLAHFKRELHEKFMHIADKFNADLHIVGKIGYAGMDLAVDIDV